MDNNYWIKYSYMEHVGRCGTRVNDSTFIKCEAEDLEFNIEHLIKQLKQDFKIEQIVKL